MTRPSLALRRPRLLLAAATGLAAFSAAAVLASSPDAASIAADGAREVFGDRAVADLEDLVYGTRDRIDLLRHDGARPEARWSLPEAKPAPTAAAPVTALEASAWTVPDVGPLYPDFAAQGDGIWVRVREDGAGRPILKKLLLHPDRARAYAELFVVAIDTAAVDLHYVPGTEEPESAAPGAAELERPARVPEAEQDLLVAAFNGGFKTRHGRHGVAADGVTLVPMRAGLCTLVGRRDGTLSLGALENVAPFEQPLFVRQTARCLVEGGQRHPALLSELTASWGAAVGGETVIRRSALGLSSDGRTLFVGVSHRTTATALADGMRHAGAITAAQLDVNEAFPRFLTYARDGGGVLRAESIAPGFHYRAGHYVSAPSSRDFFYLTKKSSALIASTTDAHAAAPANIADRPEG